MKKLILIGATCLVAGTALAQTYNVYVLPRTFSPLGPPTVVTGSDYLNALANYNRSVALEQYLRQQQMYQAGQQVANGLAEIARRRAERQEQQAEAEWNSLYWQRLMAKAQADLERSKKQDKQKNHKTKPE